MQDTPDRVRIDKWLWAARFYKTRGLAARAIEGGHVKLAGERVKPSKEVKVGDCLRIHAGEQDWEVHVLEISDRRGPATVARLLYAETEASLAQRLARLEERRLHASPAPTQKGRPTKRDRRLIHRFTGEG